MSIFEEHGAFKSLLPVDVSQNYWLSYNQCRPLTDAVSYLSEYQGSIWYQPWGCAE